MTQNIDVHMKRLHTELARIIEELKELGVQNPNAPEDWIPTPEDTAESEPDPNVVADRSEDWNERRGTLDALETRLNNIEHALAKIEAHTYGTCEVCGNTIEEDRLDANPAARTCKTHLEDEPTIQI